MNQHDFNADYDKMMRGEMTFEDMADLFMSTIVGRSTGVSRAELLARLKARFPTEQALAGYLADKLRLYALMTTPRAERPQ